MNPVPASVKALRLPQVNLVPPELALKKARGRQRAVALIFIVVFIFGLGAAAFFLETVKAGAEQDLANAHSERDRLQADIEKFSDVPRVKALLENSRFARSYAGATEIDMATFLDSFVDQLPPDAIFDDISFDRASLNGNASPGSSPFSVPDLGQITFSGWTPNETDVAELAARLESVPGIESVRITVATRAVEGISVEESDDEGNVVYTFTITARITIEALTGRFAPDDVASITEPDEDNGGGEGA